MKIKTAELTGSALDWAAAQADGIKVSVRDGSAVRDYDDNGAKITKVSVRPIYSPSAYLVHGNPLIDRNSVELRCPKGGESGIWFAAIKTDPVNDPDKFIGCGGNSTLEAACRAVVMLKIGEEVDVPEGLS